MKAEGLKDVKELQSYMIRRMERFANDHGKRIIGWDEILEGGLAPDATVMSWRGTEGGLKAIAEGHDVIFTPNHFCYFDTHQDPAQYRPINRHLPLEKVYSFDPMVEGISEENAHHILGLQGSLWTEWIMEPEYAELMLYPRAFAIAETGWTPREKKDWPDFEQRASALSKVARDWGYNAFVKPTTNVEPKP
jgi:hexosaminidase